MNERTRRPHLRVAFLGWCMVALLLTLTACSKEADQQSITLALAAPLTGNAAAFGEMMRRGADLKVKEINNAGGIDGTPLKMLYGDDVADPKEAATVARKFASDSRIAVVIGHFNSSCTLASQQIYAQAGVVQFSPGSTNSKVAEGSEWTFRNIYRDDWQGPALARYAKNALKLNRVAVFYDNDDYGIGLKTAFVEEAQRIGLAITAQEAYTRDSTDFTPQLTKFNESKPDAIFISGLYNEGALIASQARKLGITTQLLGADGLLSEDLIKIGGAAVEGLLLSAPYVFSDKDAFTKQFREAYNMMPDVWAGQAYDAVGMATEAIKAVGADRKAIREWLAGRTSPEKGYRGVTGLTYFDQHGDVQKPVFFGKVEGGKFIPAPIQLGG